MRWREEISKEKRISILTINAIKFIYNRAAILHRWRRKTERDTIKSEAETGRERDRSIGARPARGRTAREECVILSRCGSLFEKLSVAYVLQLPSREVSSKNSPLFANSFIVCRNISTLCLPRHQLGRTTLWSSCNPASPLDISRNETARRWKKRLLWITEKLHRGVTLYN